MRKSKSGSGMRTTGSKVDMFAVVSTSDVVVVGFESKLLLCDGFGENSNVLQPAKALAVRCPLDASGIKTPVPLPLAQPIAGLIQFQCILQNRTLRVAEFIHNLSSATRGC